MVLSLVILAVAIISLYERIDEKMDYNYSQANVTSQPPTSSSITRVMTERSTNSQMQGLYSQQSLGGEQQEDDDDSDDSSEDWNVYDDFNNKRPPSAMMASSAPLHPPSEEARGSYAAYTDAPRDSYAEAKRPVDFSRKRDTLIPTTAFGFDARNDDPDGLRAGERQDAASPYHMSTERFKEGGRDASRIELITVPALGNEYTNEEIKAMKKPHKRRSKVKRSGRKARSWLASDDKFCGGFSAQKVVFAAFGLLALLGILLYFVIPRIPVIAVQTVTPLVAVPDGASMRTHLKPTNFSMDMMINLRADNTAGWVPTKLKQMNMKVTDILTSKLVGEGNLLEQSFSGRKRTLFQFPVSFAYASLNATGDETWLHWVNACGPKYENTPRQSLSLQFTITMRVQGLLGQKGTSAQLADLECPFTLQADQT